VVIVTKKFAVLASLTVTLAVFAPSFVFVTDSSAADGSALEYAIYTEFAAERQVYLGMDHVGMLWYIMDYGIRENGTPFSVTRRYFTNETIRQEIIEILMDRFDIPPEIANTLYFTEFGYEYTQDGTQFAFTYIRHRDQLGNDIHGTIFDNSSEDSMRTYASVVHDHALGRALALALATLPAQ